MVCCNSNVRMLTGLIKSKLRPLSDTDACYLGRPKLQLYWQIFKGIRLCFWHIFPRPFRTD
jgi:hypothetical protein